MSYYKKKKPVDEPEFLEDRTGGTPTQNSLTNVDDFETRGTTSEDDPHGILDENIKLRQNIARTMLSRASTLADPEMLSATLKALSDNDKAVISVAKLKAEKENNENQQALIAALINETIRLGDSSRKDARLSQDIPIEGEYREVRVDLPVLDREILDTELALGEQVLSEKEVVDALNTLPDGDDFTDNPDD